jgi:hypothetical protein
MMTPPIIMMGAPTMTVSAICRKSWICWTSLVLRVISDGVPNVYISRDERCRTRANTEARRSRPTPIEARDAQYTAMIAMMPWMTVTPSITPPVRQM